MKSMRPDEHRRAISSLGLMVSLSLLCLFGVFVWSITATTADCCHDPGFRATTAIRGPLSNALELFKAHTGQYPSTEMGLAVLLERPGDKTLQEKWSGPYVEPQRLKDPWHSDYQYVCPGVRNKGSFDLSSPGPDRVSGNADDITNWPQP